MRLLFEGPTLQKNALSDNANILVFTRAAITLTLNHVDHGLSVDKKRTVLGLVFVHKAKQHNKEFAFTGLPFRSE